VKDFEPTYCFKLGDENKYFVELSAYEKLRIAHDEMVTINKALQDICKKIEPEMSKLSENLKIAVDVLKIISENSSGWSGIADEALAKIESKNL